MNANRIEPRVHCYQRPIQGGYVSAAATTPNYLRELFDAERARIEAARPRRRRRLATQKTDLQPTQLLLVAA